MTGLGLIKSIFMMLNTAESRDRKNGEDKVEVCVAKFHFISPCIAAE